MNQENPESAVAEMGRLKAALEESLRSPQEESVPVEMMQVFSDDQWPELLVECQPSLNVFSANHDVVTLHREGRGARDRPATSPRLHWLLFTRGDEQLVRPLDPTEYQAMEMARTGSSFSDMASALWPERETEQRHAAMTEILLGWVQEGLVIDVGVPIPEGAETLD